VLVLLLLLLLPLLLLLSGNVAPFGPPKRTLRPCQHGFSTGEEEFVLTTELAAVSLSATLVSGIRLSSSRALPKIEEFTSVETSELLRLRQQAPETSASCNLVDFYGEVLLQLLGHMSVVVRCRTRAALPGVHVSHLTLSCDGGKQLNAKLAHR